MTLAAVEVLHEIIVDGDDFTDFLYEIEASFDIKLPQDMRHIRTVGDLFDLIVQLRAPISSGVRCDTAMVFHQLRRAFALSETGSRMAPNTPIRMLTKESPRTLRRRLERVTGLRMPGLAISSSGCLFALALLAVASGAAIMDYFYTAMIAGAGAIATLCLDRGDWAGDWISLGDLSRAVARANVASLSRRGARSGRDHWWRIYLSMVVNGAGIQARAGSIAERDIGPATRFRWV